MSKVTTIITNYNYEKFIASAIDSVVNQTRPPDEIIIVDDKSTDNSVKIISEYLSSKKLDNISVKLIVNQINSGPAGARNSGIQVATGDIICFLDADDIYYPTKISKSLEIIEDSLDVGMVYSDYDVMDIGKNTLTREFKHPYDARILLQACIVSTNSVVRKSVFDKVGLFDTKYRGTEDYDMWLRISKNFMIMHVPESLFCYRIHGQNITMTTPHSQFAQDINEFKSRIISNYGNA